VLPAEQGNAFWLHMTTLTLAPSPGDMLAVPLTMADRELPAVKLVIATIGAAASVYATLLSVDVEAVLRLPAASCEAPAPILVITVPVVVMPETAME
jgi:hypothetical protein